MKTVSRFGVLVVGVLLAAAARAEAPPEGRGAGLGVAPFEAPQLPGDAALPPVAQKLAQRLVGLGAQRVVGPEALGAPAVAEPDPSAVRIWAAEAGVAGVVVGRVADAEGALAVEVALRSASSGEVVGRYAAEISQPEALNPALDRLAWDLLVAAARLPQGAAPAAGEEAAQGHSRFALVALGDDEPVSIRSDALEAVQKGGARRLVFIDNVRVSQADLTIRSDRLEAFYPENASQPERLVADGRVAVAQGTREARCDHATYDRRGESLVCRGSAELRDGDDRVRGETIRFDLAEERVLVTGGAWVVLYPERERRNGSGKAQ